MNANQRQTGYNRVPQYTEDDEKCSYGNVKSNFLNYQDSVAKDEYWKVGQGKESPTAVYDSMQFLSMKREKSMKTYKNNDNASNTSNLRGSSPMLQNFINNQRWHTAGNVFNFHDDEQRYQLLKGIWFDKKPNFRFIVS
jgi:hypothetical protein